MFLLPRKITELLTIGFCLLISSLQPVLGVEPSGLLNHQGRIAVDGIYFDSTTAGQLGLFKFALVSANGEELYWCNDGSRETPGEPVNAVELEVTKGLYSLMLGDATLANMSALPDDLFLENRAVWLRVWFNDSIHGFQQISPDQQFAPAPFAFIAEKANTSVAADSAKKFTDALSGDVTGTQSSTLIAPSVITGKNLEGYQPLSGELSNTDTILSALGKLEGNSSLRAPLASPTFTGTVNGITKSMVELGNVDNTADANKPVSTAQQAALDLKASLSALNLKAPLASPTFTGTVSGITKSMVGLGNVDNTADADKPISTAQQAAFLQQEERTGQLEFLQFIQANEQHVRTDALEVNKAPLESPTFTGTVSGITKSMVGLGNVDNTEDADKPISDLTQAALDGKQAVGNYATLVDGMIPVNQLPLTLDNITAAPALPVIAFGRNDLGQTTVPSLANVAEIAARESHSLVLLKNGTVVTWGNGPSVPANLESVAAVSAGSSHDLVVKTNGTVLAWGDNTYGQTAVPSGITAATQAAAGEKHSLILLSTGAVMAWGNNSFGQTTVPTAASTNVIAIAAGYDHSLALKADGSVVAWGRNDADQTSVPVGLGNVIAIAAGAYHSLAVTSDGKVVAWGWNNGGQITVPADLSGVTKVTGGYAFSAALKSDGTLVAWGNNSYSQTTVPASATQVTHLAAGANHMLALRADLIPVEVARLDQDNVFTGRVGIGRTPTTNTLEVAGNASKSIAGSWLSNSDRRIKADVKSIAGGLETLDKVRLVDFRYTDDYLAAHPEIDDKRYPNVIAQEFAEVFPDHVKETGEFLPDGSPILQVDTYPLTIYSAVAVQELHRDSLELRKQNELLRQQLSDQEDRLDKLEELLKSR